MDNRYKVMTIVHKALCAQRVNNFELCYCQTPTYIMKSEYCKIEPL